MLDNVACGYNQSVAFSFMQQLLIKSALRKWGDNVRAAGEKEVNQLHWRYVCPKANVGAYHGATN
jgi:hypothetical protein